MFYLDVSYKQDLIHVQIYNISMDKRVYSTIDEVLKERSIPIDKGTDTYMLEMTDDNMLLVESIIDYYNGVTDAERDSEKLFN